MKLGIFVTGTDTSIGKTIVSSLLVSSLKNHSIRTGYFKPIQTGLDLDTTRVSELTGIGLSKFPAPAYSFPEPMAPYRAAQLHSRQIQIDFILDQWNRLEDRAWVVEGAGGLMVPINSKHTNLDLIQALELKTLIVASTRLGTLNHSLLTCRVMRAAGIQIAGLVLVGEEDPGLQTILSDFTEAPVLAQIPYFPTLSPQVILEQSSQAFPFASLRSLYD